MMMKPLQYQIGYAHCPNMTSASPLCPALTPSSWTPDNHWSFYCLQFHFFQTHTWLSLEHLGGSKIVQDWQVPHRCTWKSQPSVSEVPPLVDPTICGSLLKKIHLYMDLCCSNLCCSNIKCSWNQIVCRMF